jgi:signal transduction histidine kinase
VPASPDLTPLLFHVERLHQRLGEIGQFAAHQDRLALLGTMAASVAHEINNILTPVKAYAELALSSPGERGLVIKALERAAQGVDRATRISELILACARPRAGTPPVCADVGEAAKRAVAAMPTESAAMFPVRIRIPAGLGAAIDAVALEQVLHNLLLNARNAMVAGGETEIVATATGADELAVAVVDRGRGIEHQRLPSVLDPFVSYAAEEPGRGTGLGLAICQRLVKEVGGRIEVESSVGEGTTVRVVLPRARGGAPRTA